MSQTRKLRMIEAGKLILEGKSLKQALIGAGFAESTARCPKKHKLHAEACVQVALAADRDVSPVDLRLSARKLFQATLDNADPKKTSLTGAARAAEIAEKIGVRDGEASPGAARTAGERLAFLARVIEAYKQAGGDVEALGAGLRPLQSTAVAEGVISGDRTAELCRIEDAPDT